MLCKQTFVGTNLISRSLIEEMQGMHPWSVQSTSVFKCKIQGTNRNLDIIYTEQNEQQKYEKSVQEWFLSLVSGL